MRSAWQTAAWAAVVGMLAAGPAPAAAPADDPLLKGLQERGLTHLMEYYLKQLGAGAEGATSAAAVGGKAVLAAAEVQKALAAKNLAERETYFRRARQFYEEAIADGRQALVAIPLDQAQARHKLRLEALKLRLDLANVIFQKWLKTDLDFLEMTDRRSGQRAHVNELLKAALDQYRAIATEAIQWLSEVDRLPQTDRSKFVNAGYDRQLRSIQREAKFNEAWVTYYYAWTLAPDAKPAEGERSRKDLLNDAITLFQAYTSMPDRVSAKWYAHLVIGMAYRELGKFNEAQQALALADNTNAPEGLKIRLVYERALTLLRKDDFKGARKAIEDARGFWGGKLDGEIYGLALPFLEAEAWFADGKKNDDEAAKAKGMEIFKQLHGKPNPWPILVQGVMDALGGGSMATGEMGPFQIWIAANDAITKAQETKEAKDMEAALGLFKAYADKAGPKDKNYDSALYFQAACHLQLGHKLEAANLFRQVAEEFPTFEYAAPAARYAVSLRGELYENAQTDENRQAYEDALKWYLPKHGAADPDQYYFHAFVLYRGAKYTEAADAFARVPEKAELYPDAKYWVPLCHLEQLREKVLATRDKNLIGARARVVAQGLLAFADYAFGAKNLSEAKQKQLLEWAQAAYINAADVYLYNEVSLPGEALPILEAMEQKFALDQEARGRVLKLKIDALQKLGRLDDAQKELATFLQVAKPEDVGPVLRGLFHAMTDDVKELIRRGQRDVAGVKVEQAKILGDRLVDWLQKSALPDKAERVENYRYDLAELYLAVGHFTGALAIYQDIGGPKPESAEIIKEDCVYGMARAYEGLGEQSASPAESRQHLERAIELWRLLVKAAEAERRGDRNVMWDRRYHLYYCKFRLGDRKEVGEALKAEEAMGKVAQPPEPLGGKDPIIQKKFRDLWAAVFGGGDLPSQAPPAAQPAPAAAGN